MSHLILPGRPSPLGARWDGQGVNFAVFSENADRIDLCLYDPGDPSREIARIPLPESTGHVWHGYVPGLGPGQPYGLRALGPYSPNEGLRFNPAKLLIDPYAKALLGAVNWEAPVFGYPLGNPEEDLVADPQDDAFGVPRGIVIDEGFDWGADRRPRIPWNDTIIYEAHVRGLTIQHPEIPPELRGTYAGIAHPVMIEHYRRLGITAIELMPIHSYLIDKVLVDRGLTNYWGYNTLAFFAPEARYATGGGGGGREVVEVKEMVKALHAAGIEVILDVVYNHTAEGNHLGPTLSFRGLDNPSYYRLMDENPRFYKDYTGTGNSLNARNPQVLKLIMDSLRYWAIEMRVDGFRFDLAATLARELHDVHRLSSFLDTIHQDPVLSDLKLIAEPWDVGPGGYQVGNFPVLWSEWNGKYRDAIRAWWKGDPGSMAELGYRLTGSSDLYSHNGRRPYASINFVTAHDGFTLNDLVSYNEKHNEANGEENRDGESHNRSWNHGVEGPTDNPDIVALRERQKRNFLATLLFSQGVPMLLMGDEFSRTQQGNNNAYCQDNPISWVDWQLNERQRQLLDFTQRVVRLRQAHPALHRRRFFQGRAIYGAGVKDITWFRPDGVEMTEDDWNQPWARALAVWLAGDQFTSLDANTMRPVTDDDLLILLNASADPVTFTLPGTPAGASWRFELETSSDQPPPPPPGDTYTLSGRALALLVSPARRPAEPGPS